MSGSITRRSFLSLSAAAAALGALPRVSRGGTPVTRVLGRTGLKVSEVGMGVMITSDPAVVRAALDAGITYFDTARAYLGGRNEEILGRGLGARRKDVVVATKCHHLDSAASILRSAEESLKTLGTDFIDVFQLHGLSSRGQVMKDSSREAIAALKKAGKIRFAGVTTHGGMSEVITAAVEAGTYDTVLTSFNFQIGADVVAAVKAAAAAGLGVVAMKVMTGGYAMTAAPGFTPHQSALRWVLRQEGVACAIPSMTSLEQVRDDAAVMGTSYSLRDRLHLKVYGAVTADRYCRACGSCAGSCPRGVDVPRALRAVMYAEGYGEPGLARETLAGCPLPCGDCGSCAVACAHGIPVRERLETARSLARGGDAA